MPIRKYDKLTQANKIALWSLGVALAGVVITALDFLRSTGEDTAVVTPLCEEGAEVRRFQGHVGHPKVGGGDDFAEFLADNEECIVYLNVDVPSDLIERETRGTLEIVRFEIAGTPPTSWTEVVELNVGTGTDYYRGDLHNGDTNLKGHFRVMGSAGLGTGLAVTTLRALSLADVRAAAKPGG